MNENSYFLKVGLTGSLGSGKSEVRKIFASLGAFTIDADLIARELTAPGEVAYTRIVECWGKSVLNGDGSLNRRALADTIFANPEDSDKLNEMFHPLIIQKEDELAAEHIKAGGEGIIVTEAALMIETGSWRRFDKIILVACPEDIRLKRVREARGLDKELFDLISKRQMPEEEKLKFADYVINNSGTMDELIVQTRSVYYKLYDDIQYRIDRG